VTLGGSPTGTMADANAGNGKSVTVSGYTISGAKADNYSLEQPIGVTVDITGATLPTVTFIPPESLVYNRTAKTFQASATGPSGLTLTYTGRNGTTYNSTTAPTNVGDYTVTATSSDNNYTESQAENFSITAKALTVSAPTLTTSKAYDGDNTAAVTAGSLTGVETGDTVSVSASAAYNNASVGTGKTITVTYTLGGADLANYTAPASTEVNDGVITAKGLNISAPTLTTSKTYDGNTTAEVTAGSLSGVVGSEDVTVTAAASYDNKNVGADKTITVTYTLEGENAGNYTAPANDEVTTGGITAKALSITSPTITSKTYDGTTTAGAVTVGDLSGFVGDETVTATAIAADYSSANAGTYNNVVVTYSLSNGANGGLATNYSLAAGTATGVITKATPTITAAPTASAITLGDALSDSNLSGGTATGVDGEMEGEFAFTEPNTVPEAVGPFSAGVTFTPSDTTNYNNATTTISVTVSSAGEPLPEGAKVGFVEGNYVILDGANQPLEDVTYTRTYAGREVEGLSHSYLFLAHSGSQAPAAPGFYTVSVTAAGAYTGTLPLDFEIAGPLQLPPGTSINVSKVAGATTVRFNRSTLLGALQRVTEQGTLATGATGLSWTTTTAGVSSMPSGVEPMTQPNTVTHTSSFVTLTPPGNGTSEIDAFTITVSDGHTWAIYPVTATSTAAPPFDLQIRKKVPLDEQNDVAIFLTRPNRTIEMEFKTQINEEFQPVQDPTKLVSSDQQNATMQGEGQQQHLRPPAPIDTGSTGVIQLIVPRNGSMFFQARPVVAPAPSPTPAP